MTSEVAILNRQAVALAADSALTVTYWVGGKREHRFFKGANKIFHLAKYQPVGLMTFDTAGLHGVPWELIVKAFRKHLSNRSHDHLSEYTTDLFDFIENNTFLFPLNYQEQVFRSECHTAALMFYLNVSRDEEFKRKRKISTRKRFVDKKINELRQEVEKKPFAPRLAQNNVDDAINKYKKDVVDKINKDVIPDRRKRLFDAEKLACFSINAVFKNYYSTIEKTGLVIAGYGENEYFPNLEVFECYGMMLGKIMYKEVEKKKISPNNVSEITAFAQTDTVNTFINGVSFEILGKISTGFREALAKFETDIKTNLNVQRIQNINSIKKDIHTAFFDNLYDYMLDSHTRPLKRVIGALPIAEMATLAETLISVESLKERVTKPSESVSGPIDVAVISKGEGFIWIKRKHYFEPSLNPRYFQKDREDL